MAKPKLHPHQSAATAPEHEAPFEFDSANGDSGGLLTLTDTGEGLVVDLFNLDPTVRVRVPAESLWTQEPRMTKELAAAILRVVAYNWDDEQRDYGEQDAECRNNHIYIDLRAIREALTAFVQGR